ncbi:MAG: sugar transferase [Candidatus Woesebacteria bacterium]|jgi:O-antigen biosynthesis protein WbqP
MYKKYIKRLLDIAIASIALILALPIALLIALVIKLDDRGPVFFKHKRYGQNKNPFTIYKFRTMKTTAPKSCPTNDLTNHEQHIMRSGKILRKLSLDELPQLINVLQGKMSLVGPRPVILEETDLIAERDKYGANECKPGITGWAQVSGRDELRMKIKARMDGEYAKSLGFWMDLKCILLTFWAVVSVKGHREGATTDDSPQCFELEGEGE